MSENVSEPVSEHSDISGWAFDGHGRLLDLNQPPEVETFGPPPHLRWVSPIDLPQIFGLRCALSGPRRTVYDLRCSSEVFESNGGTYVNVVDESQWYRWLETPESRRPERIPRATCIGARHLWIEITDQSPSPEKETPT